MEPLRGERGSKIYKYLDSNPFKGGCHLTTERQWLLRKLFNQRAYKKVAFDGSMK